MIAQWRVTAEVNMCAEHYESVIVKANTERKARIMGEKKLREKYFFLTNVSVKKLDAEEILININKVYLPQQTNNSAIHT